MTILSEEASVCADEITLYFASSYHLSHRFHKEHAFIYTIRGEKEEKIGITGRIVIRENRYVNVFFLFLSSCYQTEE